MFMYGLIYRTVCTFGFVASNVRQINDKSTKLALFTFMHFLVVLGKFTVGCIDIFDYTTQYTTPHKQPQTISLPTVLLLHRAVKGFV